MRILLETKNRKQRNRRLSSIYSEPCGMFGVLSRQDFLARFVISLSSDSGVLQFFISSGCTICAMIVFVSCFSARQNVCTILYSVVVALY